MKFNKWDIVINNLNSRHDIINNDESFVILDKGHDTKLVLKSEGEIIKVKYLSYDNELSIDTKAKKIIINLDDYDFDYDY
ncbi:hypothetical protein [Staphylococcus pasteuri]|uniref:hypothetical protein n=1 Tax=Staphylococcus pasteuri TaxID=45972 RepID=UPI001AD89897|nr:hypothetical protein [Staphylococcus pasteuri]MCT1927065.1 hypothetical protein [Staphylococcus pasteuri]QQT11705.1 hypothetical protein I6J09_02880 [Staphylococcus pasteuri]